MHAPRHNSILSQTLGIEDFRRKSGFIRLARFNVFLVLLRSFKVLSKRFVR